MSGELVPLRERASYIASIVGKDEVCLWENLENSRQQRLCSAIEPKAAPPSCIVTPQSQAQLAAVIAAANENKWRILTCGSTSKIGWGGLASNIDIVISTEHINKIIEHAVGDLTVTVEAGMKFAQLQAVLTKTNQFLALDPTAANSATIGGIVATSDTNSLRQRYGGVRDQLLGITFVRADGQIVKAGGRVVKNVAGYDLMKLFTGSYGTLGVITQVTFRLYPMQSASKTVVLTGESNAVQKAADILRGSALTPTQADLISTKLVSQLDLGKGLGLVVRFESIVQSVEEQSNRLLEVGKELGLQGGVYSTSDEIELWQRLQHQIHIDGETRAIVCKIGVMPTAISEVLNQAEVGFVHMSSGLGMLRFASEKGVEAMRLLCQKYSGFLSVLEAPTAIKQQIDLWGYGGNALELMRQIKQQFDPKDILNPGRFVGGI